VIQQDAVISRMPDGLSDTAQTQRYVAAIEGAAASPATFVWLQDSRARIHATLSANQVLSVQVTHHPGWKATAGTLSVPISKDGLGQMVGYALGAGSAGARVSRYEFRRFRHVRPDERGALWPA